MRILSIEEFKVLIEAGHETRNVEFKQAFSWDDIGSVWLREKVIQTILGMANTGRREDKETACCPVGITSGTPLITLRERGGCL